MPKIDKLYHIRYLFRFEQQVKREFTIFLERGTNDLVQPVREEEPLPKWAELEHAQCRNCPLSTKEYKYCPTARAMVDVVEFFRDFPSYETAEVTVETEQRTISSNTSVQEGVRSLMGLLMPVSGCPILGKLKPMTWLHLPFSSIDETVFKTVSTYLVDQYFASRFGGDPTFDLSGLQEIYEQVHEVNVDFLERLRSQSDKDANLNSLVSLDVFTMAIPRAIDKELERFLPLFLPADEEEGESCK